MSNQQERVVASYKVLVGMEIHVQLATKSKMFTGAANGFGGTPNSQVDAQVLGLPGTLPVMNRKAVEYSIMVGLALGCKIAKHTKWDRKSYYYPDLPKNYQISQYDLPLCFEGTFELPIEGDTTKTIRIRRAHLEEDAGKLLHEAPGGYAIDHSIVDLNRAGTPLLEIVTEPDFSTPEEIRAFGQELQRIVQFLGVSEAQVQDFGHMRFEPNINVHITDASGQVHKTAITEIKNLNSFSVLEKATAFEVRRQIDQWVETGALGKKSTYGWDESTQSTFHQRDKEEANDYRYFPDPDLMPVEVSDAWLTELKSQVGELPAVRRKRYIETLGLNEKDAATLLTDRATGDFFERVVVLGVEPKRAANLLEALRETPPERMSLVELHRSSPVDRDLTPQQVADVAKLAQSGRIAANKDTAKSVLMKMMEEKTAAEEAAASLGLLQSSDAGPVDAAIDALLATNPKSAQDYKAGKQAALGSLVGMVMKSTKGLNPKIVQERLKERLS